MMDKARRPDLGRQVVIIGGGPAGLTAAYELVQLGIRPIVVEQLAKVGGISRTENVGGYYFDMGGHRFFTKEKSVDAFWHQVLGEDLLRRPRLSRIFYQGIFFNYPLKPANALMGLGLWESALVIASYLRWQFFPYREEKTFEQWVTNRFGKRLFSIFFKTYTEKVWGIPCSELQAEWAAQRIKDLSLKTAVISMFVKPRNTVRTLIDEFDYPRRGPGMFWEAVKNEVEDRGGIVQLNSEVVQINRNGSRVESVVVSTNGATHTIPATDVLSSMPINDLARRMCPSPPSGVMAAADQLKHRDFLTVCLLVDQEELFHDNWIYIHDPSVHVGRIQNFKSWSPDMVADQTKSALGLEYFCNEGDEFWTMPDRELVELGKRELDQIGLARCEDVEDGYVFRVPKAYPVYDADYAKHLSLLRRFIESLGNVQTMGRNGLHRYNNMDHTILTAMLAVRNLVLDEAHDLWAVNAEQEYHEAARSAESSVTAEGIRDSLARAFPKLDPLAFGTAIGLVAGAAVCLATLVLVARGGHIVGPTLGLLSQFFPGYRVTAYGSLIGLLYGILCGFIAGWGSAVVRNVAVFLNMAILQRRAELQALPGFWDCVY